LEYKPAWDHCLPSINPVPDTCRQRQEITLELARDFLKYCKKQKCRFEPLGVVQGWSPKSYSYAFSALQKMGYKYIALGGMVPLKSDDILQVLETVSPKLKSSTRLHLFGVTRLDYVRRFSSHGVISFDSTSPLRQAFKEDRNNYYAQDRNYVAIRIPQVDVNIKLKNRVLSGEVQQAEAFRLERECLEGLQKFDQRRFPRKDLLQLLMEYQELCGASRNYASDYEELLRDRPWKDCPCTICQQLGIHVVIFRGAERNRRRGFHNLYVTFNKLKTIRRRSAYA
jgi:queuine/archaeosine tRNA-ribosyltransferase